MIDQLSSHEGCRFVISEEDMSRPVCCAALPAAVTPSVTTTVTTDVNATVTTAVTPSTVATAKHCS